MIYITDLSSCTPRSALSSEAAQGKWQTIPYETCDEEPGKGVMLGAASFVDAPEIRLPLDVSGWHSVYIGFWNLHLALFPGLAKQLVVHQDRHVDKLKLRQQIQQWFTYVQD